MATPTSIQFLGPSAEDPMVLGIMVAPDRTTQKIWLHLMSVHYPELHCGVWSCEGLPAEVLDQSIRCPNSKCTHKVTVNALIETRTYKPAKTQTTKCWSCKTVVKIRDLGQLPIKISYCSNVIIFGTYLRAYNSANSHVDFGHACCYVPDQDDIECHDESVMEYLHPDQIPDLTDPTVIVPPIHYIPKPPMIKGQPIPVNQITKYLTTELRRNGVIQ